MKKNKKFLLSLLFILLLMPLTAYAGEETTSNIGLTCDNVKYATQAYFSLRIIAPFLLIIFGSIDFFKAVVANDTKKQQEARSKFPKRVIACLLLVALPFFVEFIFTSFGQYSSNNMSILCCIVSNGNSQCTAGVTSSGGSSGTGSYNRTNPTNSDYIDEDESNMPGGDNYVSPVTRRKTVTASECINSYYGECSSVNVSTGKCTCTYTSRENLSKTSLCENDPYHVGMKTQQEGSGGAMHVTCYYNARLSESGQTISNLTSLSTTPPLLAKVAKTNNNFDAYFAYERKITNTSASTCATYENNEMYCSSDNSCICIYGKGIIPSSQASDTDYNRTIDDSNAARNSKITRYNTIVSLLNTAQLNGSKYYRQEVKDFGSQHPYGAAPSIMYPVSSTVITCVNNAKSYYSTIQTVYLSVGMIVDACDNLDNGQKEWVESYIKSFIAEHYITQRPTPGELDIAISYLEAMDSIYQQGFDVFLGNIEEFNELNSYFGFPSASTGDYNTEKIFQCVRPDGTLGDCSN